MVLVEGSCFGYMLGIKLSNFLPHYKGYGMTIPVHSVRTYLIQSKKHAMVRFYTVWLGGTILAIHGQYHKWVYLDVHALRCSIANRYDASFGMSESLMIIITGGGSGIGRALARCLSEAGEQVLIVGRRQQALAETATGCARMDTLCADLSTKEGRARLVEYAQDIPHIKGLVHNAGTISPMDELAKVRLEEWQALMALNVEAPLFLTQALLEKLADARVLHIGSGAAYFPVHAWGAYCSSKAALSMITRTWQEEQPQLAIASVMPGITDTDMMGKICQSTTMDSEKRQFFEDLKQSDRLLKTDCVARFLEWLLLEISPEEFRSKEWDIYDTTDQARWLRPPFQVPHWDAD